jgi:hypothetical protein
VVLGLPPPGGPAPAGVPADWLAAVGDATRSPVWTSAIPGNQLRWQTAAVGRRERTMSDHLGLHFSNQAGVGGPAWGAEVIPWGSMEASEAVHRICQRVAMRCHQAMTTHRPADAPDEQIDAAT